MKAQKAKKMLLTKKELKKEAVNKIEGGLTELRDRLGEEKFHKRVKKAVKVLTNGIPKNAMEKNTTEKNATEKKAKKLTADPASK